MERIRLGGSSLAVSRLCFGCAGIGGYDYGPVDDETSVAAVRRAVDLGINFFDVADVYGFGRAEQVLARALGARTKDVVIATKFGVRWDGGRTSRDISPAYLRQALEASLRRLGLESIPLYQIHWPDGTTGLIDCIAELEACRREGKIGHYGACNLGLREVEACQQSGALATLQVPYSLVESETRPLLDSARERFGIGTLVYNALGHGLLSGKHDRNSQFSGTDMRTRLPLFRGERLDRALQAVDRVRAVAGRTGRTCVQVALNWAAYDPAVSVAIVGLKKPAQVEEAAGAVGWRLDKNDRAYLSREDQTE